jgi:hypothetical protein
VAEDAQSPSNTGCTEDAEFGTVVDDDVIVAADTEFAHGLGEDLRAGQHVRVRGAGVRDRVKVEEAARS